MHKLFPSFRTLLLLTIIASASLAQTPSALPVEIQRQEGKFYLVAHPQISGFRVALYDRTGILRAKGEALAGPPLRWPVRPIEGESLGPGVYFCVFWLRGQNGAEKQLARLEVQSNTMKLQAADQYLDEVMPSDSVVWGTTEYRAVERRAKARGLSAVPFFRTATKVLPEETAAWLLLVQALHLKAGRFPVDLFAPPPPPPPPPVLIAPRKSAKTLRRKKVDPVIDLLPQPTLAEKQEALAACQQAVAVAKSCPEKTHALLWLASAQADLEQESAQLATLEQIAQASCASNEIKAQSWYNIGVLSWHCAYQLTTRYANPLASEPFHYRNFTKAADQRKFEDCLQRGITALEKALALNPDDANTWSYRSLLYRERQKTTASPAEQQKFADAAEQAVKRSLELMQKQPK